MRRDVFQAIADPSRRAILMLLAFQPMTPNAIAEHFDNTRQAVSKHIKVLSECDLLRQEKQGREIVYHLNRDSMKEVENWLKGFQSVLEKRFDQLDHVLLHMKNKNKK